MNPKVKFDGWEEWFYKHEDELISGTYVTPSQKIGFKCTLPNCIFSFASPESGTYRSNPFAIQNPCSTQTSLLPPNFLNHKPFSPHPSSPPWLHFDPLPTTSIATNGKNTTHSYDTAFIDFSHRSDGFHLLRTTSTSNFFPPPATPFVVVSEAIDPFEFYGCDPYIQSSDQRLPLPLSLSATNSRIADMANKSPSSDVPVLDTHPTSPMSTEYVFDPRPLSIIPGDSSEVDLFDPSIDASYIHIPLSKENIALLYPLPSLQSKSLLLNRTLIPPFEYAKFKSLPRGDANWNTWVARLKKFDGGTWRKQGLYQLIQMSTTDVTFDLDLLEGVIRLWAPPCNSFIFACGPMSITLQDILQFTGLPLLGNDMASLINTEGLPQLSEKFLNTSSYSQVIRHWYARKLTSPSPDERISFMWVLICKYLFCPSSGKPTMEYLPLARSLSVGNTHGLGIMLLGSFYKWMNVTVNETPISRLNGVSWILQMWLFSYFSELRYPLDTENKHLSWKELLESKSKLTVAEVFTFFRSLHFTWPLKNPHHFVIEVEAYPWIEHLANERKTSVDSIVEAIRTAILHPRFLVPDGSPLHDNSTHSFEFYNPALYPFQLGFCPQIPASILYLPQSLNEMTTMGISQRKLTSLALLELSEQSNLFKNPIVRLPIAETDDYLPWWTARYADIIPDSLEVPDIQSIERKWDLSSTRQSKKTKHVFETSPKPIKIQQEKEMVSPFRPRKRTRASTRLSGEISKSKLKQPRVSEILEDDNDFMPSATNVSIADSETESDKSTHFTSLSSPLGHVATTPKGHASGSKSTLLADDFLPQDLTTRRALVSSVEEDMDFDFSFLGSGPSHTVSSSSTPSGLELATAKASLRHFLNMSLSSLGTIEKATVLSAASILKSSSEFSQPSAFSGLDTLDSMFTSFHHSSSTCSETLIQVGNFKARKEKLDVMLSERKTLLSTLQQKNKDFDVKEELVKRLETELVQHKADLITLLHDNEALKVSTDELKFGIQSLGNELVDQKEAYKLWEDTLTQAEAIRAECHSKWEDLRKLDLS